MAPIRATLSIQTQSITTQHANDLGTTEPHHCKPVPAKHCYLSRITGAYIHQRRFVSPMYVTKAKAHTETQGHTAPHNEMPASREPLWLAHCPPIRRQGLSVATAEDPASRLFGSVPRKTRRSRGTLRNKGSGPSQDVEQNRNLDRACSVRCSGSSRPVIDGNESNNSARRWIRTAALECFSSSVCFYCTNHSTNKPTPSASQLHGKPRPPTRTRLATTQGLCADAHRFFIKATLGLLLEHFVKMEESPAQFVPYGHGGVYSVHPCPCFRVTP